MEQRTNEGYENMLEKYRNINEDEILSCMTQEELEQLEGEIDREVLNQIPEEKSEGSISDHRYDTTSESDISEREEDEEYVIPAKSTEPRPETKAKNIPYHYGRRRSSLDERRRLGKSPLRQFKIPTLRKTPSREKLKRQSSEEGGELKRELLQAAKQRSKRRTGRANSIGLRRYTRKNSSLLKRRNSKVLKEDRHGAPVNSNHVTTEMLSLRPKLKKVQTREPAKLNDVLHGVCLKHVTSGVKQADDNNQIPITEDKFQQSDDDSDESTSSADIAVTEANDNVHRRLKATPHETDMCDDIMTMTSSTTAGSTSAESYDVIGELSINPNSVEETLLRVWENDPALTEVNLNNIQNVNMETFEELANAMVENTHVQKLLLANTGLTDRAGRAIASMLKRNKTLEILNVESNFITGDGALRIVSALRRNHGLLELRIDNQRHIFGAKVEHEFSKILKDNKTIIRFGYQFANPGPRISASNYLTKNVDNVRKKRVAEQKLKAKAGIAPRPTLRRQTSSEWYRKEKADKLHKLKDLNLDSNVLLHESDVQNLLDKMNPHEVKMLESWFASKLIGRVSLSDANQGNTGINKIETKMPSIKKSEDKKTKKKAALNPRGDLLDSLRSKSPMQCLKHVEKPTGKENPTMQEKGKKEEHVTTQAHIQKPNAETQERPAEQSSTDDDIIEYKEGEEYDSDEYEVVEIEVPDSEASSDDNVATPRPELNIEDKLKTELDTLHIAGKSGSNNVRKMEPLIMIPKLNSPSSLDSPSPRPIKEDESWISGKPYYTLGSK